MDPHREMLIWVWFILSKRNKSELSVLRDTHSWNIKWRISKHKVMPLWVWCILFKRKKSETSAMREPASSWRKYGNCSWNIEQRRSKKSFPLVPRMICHFLAYVHHVPQVMNPKKENLRFVWKGSVNLEVIDRVTNENVNIKMKPRITFGNTKMEFMTTL